MEIAYLFDDIRKRLPRKSVSVQVPKRCSRKIGIYLVAKTKCFCEIDICWYFFLFRVTTFLLLAVLWFMQDKQNNQYAINNIYGRQLTLHKLYDGNGNNIMVYRSIFLSKSYIFVLFLQISGQALPYYGWPS